MNDGVSAEVDNLSDSRLMDYIANLNKFPASACTKAINKDFFIVNKLYFKKGIFSEDLEWGIRLFLSIRSAAYCPHDYYRYRQGRKGSISSMASEKHYLDILHTVEMYGDAYINEKNYHKRKLVFSFLEYIYRLLILGFQQMSKEHRENYKKQLKKYSFVLGTRKDRKSRIIYGAYKLLGVKLSCLIMSRYLKLR